MKSNPQALEGEGRGREESNNWQLLGLFKLLSTRPHLFQQATSPNSS